MLSNLPEQGHAHRERGAERGGQMVLPCRAVARQAVSAFDAVLHLERGPEGRRLVAVGALALDRRGRLEARS